MRDVITSLSLFTGNKILKRTDCYTAPKDHEAYFGQSKSRVWS